MSTAVPPGLPRSAGPAGLRGRWRTLRHSIGLRVVLLFLVLALATVAIFVGGMTRALSAGWKDAVRPIVSDYVDRLATELGVPPDPVRAQALAARLPLSVHIDGPLVNWDSEPARADRGHRQWTPTRGPADVSDGENHDGDGWLLTRVTADGHRIHFGLGRATWPERPRAIGWVTLSLLLLMTALAYAYVRHLLRPLADIHKGAVRFGRGELGTPIAVRRPDELGELATQVNTMAASLGQMLEAKRELLLAISHELRSPLTRARLNTELLSDHDDNRAPRDALLRDLAEMRELITSLLESERLSSGHAALHLGDIRLDALVQEVLSAHFDGRAVDLDLSRELPPLRLDGTRIRLLLRNLLDNALRHGAGGVHPPQLSTAHEGGMAVIRVRDFGPGVPESRLAQLGEAFFRTDSARQRSTGGVGLGLHLCQRVVQAHGGFMTLRNAQPGLEVQVRLPLAVPA